MTATPPIQRPWWHAPALLGAFLLPVVVAVHAIRGLTVYLTADAGHALADADALRGHGVRAAGHAPVFPAITAVVTGITSDLSALRLLAIVATLVMSGSFYFFVRGRSGSPFAEVLGTVVFGLAPTTAEALGYFGLVMLLGIAFAIGAMRAIDDWLVSPSVRRATIAGLLIALTAFTHTVGLVWLVEVSAVVGLLELLRITRTSPEERRQMVRRLVRTGPIILGCTAVAAAEATSFLGGLDNPVRISPSIGRLDLIRQFGFRSGAVFWIGLLIAALIVLPAVARVEDRLRRLATWSLIAGIVAAANLVAIDADLQYETRQVYLLALPAAVTVVCVAARLRRTAVARTLTISTVALVLAASGVVSISARVFDERLQITMPYYSHVHPDELAALEWLHAHRGVTLVAGHAADFYSGSEYAWMIEGISKARAFAPAQGPTNLFADQRLESDDAATFVAGATVTIGHGLMAGASPKRDTVQVFRRFDHAWLPMADLRSTSPRGAAASRFTISLTRTGISIASPGGELSIDARNQPLTRRGALTSVGGDGDTIVFRADSPSVVVTQVAGRAERTVSTTFETAQLLKKHDVRWIWVWDEPSSDVLSDLVNRGGVSVDHREGNVVLLKVGQD